jgi:aldose 1-epimerase
MHMKITEESFGRLEDGRAVQLYTLANEKGMTVKITDFGGIIVSIETPDRAGHVADVTLGFDRLDAYTQNPAYFGALIGRYANRIGNAAFTLNGAAYRLQKNDGNNHLHGGEMGFHKVLWDSAVIADGGAEKLELKYLSKDGEEGYPGNLSVRVLYSLSGDNAIVIEYFAEADRDTIVNLTNHAYFNLGGHDAGSITDHRLYINAGSFTPIDSECIPTGEIRTVVGSPMDFTAMRPIGKGLAGEELYEQLRFGYGYDHNYVIDNEAGGITKAAEVIDDKSGRRMEVFTDKPGIQLYSGNHLDGIAGKGGAVYGKRCGFCLETQYFPDSPHKKDFPSAVLRAGEKYRFTTIYRFSTVS